MNKRKIIISIAITLAGYVIAELCAVNAQDLKREAGYKRPVQLKLGLAGLTESFYPIGWSENGAFAYIVEPADEACGCYFANLVIKDLKTDKVLWHFDYESTGFDEKDNKPKSIRAFWQFNQKLFSKKLREHQIRQKTGFVLEFFPIINDGDELTVTLSVERDRKRWETQFVSAIGVQVSSKRKGKKIVYEDRDLADSQVLDATLLGYLKSSLEPRIALILIEVHRGYEGPPNVAKVKLVGSDLSSGFK